MIERKLDTDHFERRSRSADDRGYVSRLRYEDKRKHPDLLSGGALYSLT